MSERIGRLDIPIQLSSKADVGEVAHLRQGLLEVQADVSATWAALQQKADSAVVATGQQVRSWLCLRMCGCA